MKSGGMTHPTLPMKGTTKDMERSRIMASAAKVDTVTKEKVNPRKVVSFPGTTERGIRTTSSRSFCKNRRVKVSPKANLEKKRPMLQAISQLPKKPIPQEPPMVRLGADLHMEISQDPRQRIPGMKSTMTVQQADRGTQKMA